jgi:hypothetical protein
MRGNLEVFMNYCFNTYEGKLIKYVKIELKYLLR